VHRTRVPNTFSGGMREDPLPAPRLGENTTEILADVGYTEAEISAMFDNQIAFGLRESDS